MSFFEELWNDLKRSLGGIDATITLGDDGLGGSVEVGNRYTVNPLVWIAVGAAVAWLLTR